MKLEIKNKKWLKLVLFLSCFLIISPRLVFAGEVVCQEDTVTKEVKRIDQETKKEVFSVVPCPTGCIVDKTPCPAGAEDYTLCDGLKLITNVQTMAMSILGPVALLFLIIAGVLYLIGSLSPAWLSQAKKLWLSVIVGLIIILVSWIIVNTIGKGLGWTKATGEGGSVWDKFTIDCNG